MKLVIRVHDECGSFFCGFANIFSEIRLSTNKKDAIVYEATENKIRYDMMKIVQSSGGKLLCSAQQYESAPDAL